MSIFPQREIMPVGDVPWAQAIEARATVAITKNAICYIDSVTGVVPYASPANSQTAANSTPALYLAVNAGSTVGDRVLLVPYRVVTGVNTAAAAVRDPIYLAAAGAWSLSPGAHARVVGTVLAVSATEGKIELSPGLSSTRQVSQLEVVDHRFFDDFDELDTDWVKTAVAGGTTVVGDALYGVLTITNAAGDNDGTQSQYAQETFVLTAGKRLFFEALVRLPHAGVTELDWFVGLAAAENLTTAADSLPANGIGFHKDDGDLLIDLSSSLGGANQQSAALATLVANTWIKLGLAFDGGAHGAATITPYINGVAGTPITGVNYTSMGEMAAICMVRNGDGTAKILEVDYVNAIQAR